MGSDLTGNFSTTTFFTSAAFFTGSAVLTAGVSFGELLGFLSSTLASIETFYSLRAFGYSADFVSASFFYSFGFSTLWMVIAPCGDSAFLV